MSDESKMLLDIAGRMMERGDLQPIVLQLREMQKSFNACVRVLQIIAVV